MKKAALCSTLFFIIVIIAIMFVSVYAQSQDNFDDIDEKFLVDSCNNDRNQDDIIVSLTNSDDRSHIDHEGSEDCIYSCIHDYDQSDSNVSSNKADNLSHIDHEGSENCRYSCSFAMNNYPSGSSKKDVSIREPLNAMDLKNLIDEYTGVVTDSLVESKKVLADMLGVHVDPDSVKSSDDVDPKILIDEYTGVATDSLDESKKILADMLGASIEEIDGIIERAGSPSLYCLLYGHNLIIYPCTGDHGVPNEDCEVNCKRLVTCFWPDNSCTWYDFVNVREIAHSWSVGWCGQTCTNCGIIQMFHEPGGCWFCD